MLYSNLYSTLLFNSTLNPSLKRTEVVWFRRWDDTRNSAKLYWWSHRLQCNPCLFRDPIPYKSDSPCLKFALPLPVLQPLSAWVYHGARHRSTNMTIGPLPLVATWAVYLVLRFAFLAEGLSVSFSPCREENLPTPSISRVEAPDGPHRTWSVPRSYRLHKKN